jgi:hypothetical protein
MQNLDYEDKESSINQLVNEGYSATDHNCVINAMQLYKLISLGQVNDAIDFYRNSSFNM